MCNTYETGCPNVYGYASNTTGNWFNGGCGCGINNGFFNNYPRICRDCCGCIHVYNPCQQWRCNFYANAGTVNTNTANTTNTAGTNRCCPYATAENTINVSPNVTNRCCSYATAGNTINASPNVTNRCCCLANNTGTWWTGTNWVTIGCTTTT